MTTLEQLKRTTVKDVIQHCDGFQEGRQALRTLRSLESKRLLDGKEQITDKGKEIAFKPTE